MSKPTDVSPASVALYFLPTDFRVPFKFGAETVNFLTLARMKMTVKNAEGQTAEGWGETPISVAWGWPSSDSYDSREVILKDLCKEMAQAWSDFSTSGHPVEMGHDFQNQVLPGLLKNFNARKKTAVPLLAALICSSAFDIALHDAYGVLNNVSVYSTYNGEYMNHDLSHFLQPASHSGVNFANLYPQDFLTPRQNKLPVWHLVGGKDPISPSELTGEEPTDGYPVLLRDWIHKDGIECLKIKLRGNDEEWDYARTVEIGKIGIEENVNWLTVDFNCLVTEPAYVNRVLDRLLQEHPRIYGMILYVEQPFPYEIEENRIDVHSVSARKPLFMDESAHDWKMVKLGRELGWTGVALKTCKTQTGALLSLCWAKAHGMTLMVQDLTNPSLAQIPHLLLAAYAGTIMGVESNAMQFYPKASTPEAKVHPGIFERRLGILDISSIKGPGFGYRISEIHRELPSPVFTSH